MTKVSVCIPVYGVEKYIERCARSLFEQTLDDIRYIFVNDCTPDRSIEILKRTLEDYPQRKSQVTIIDHPYNCGLGKARATAIKYLMSKFTGGGYVIHCDSDDYIECDMYERMYECAVASNADMVYCDYIQEKSGKFLHKSGGSAETVDGIINEMFSREAPQFLWNKMYKSEIALRDYSQTCPEYINCAEDGCRNYAMLRNCQSVAHCHRAFYHYCRRENSITMEEQINTDYKYHVLEVYNICDRYYTEEKYQNALDYRRRQALYYAITIPGFPAKKWNSLYNRAKRGIWHDRCFPLPMKLIFALTTVNFQCGVLAHRTLRILYSLYLKVKSVIRK